jgi:hypothetical protein
MTDAYMFYKRKLEAEHVGWLATNIEIPKHGHKVYATMQSMQDRAVRFETWTFK